MSTTNSNDDETITEQLRLQRAKTRLKSVKILSTTGILGLTIAGIGAWVLAGNQIVISDEMKVFAVSILGFGGLFSPLTVWAVKKLWNPNLVFVAEVNAASESVVDVHAAAPDKWADVNVVSGEPASFSIYGRTVYLVTDFTRVEDVGEDDELAQHVPEDASGWVAAGTWLGEASDAEIVSERIQIDGNRRRNNAWAKIGEKLYAKFESVAKSVESRHHKTMADKSMDMTLFDSETVKQEAADAVPELEEYDEEQSMPEIIEDEVEQQLRDINTDDTRIGDSSE